MGIRFANPEDKQDVRKLWECCFKDSMAYNDYYFDAIYQPMNTILYENQQGLTSACQLNHHRLSYKGSEMDATYIVGVSTWPSWRERGYMKKVMKASLEEIGKRNQVLSFLLPVDNRLYEPFGYGYMTGEKIYHIDGTELDTIDLGVVSIKNSGLNVNFVDYEDLEELGLAGPLVRFYHERHEEDLLWVERDATYWGSLATQYKIDGGALEVALNQNQVLGYMAYYIHQDKIEIMEIQYKSLQVLKLQLERIKLKFKHHLHFTFHERTRGYLSHVLPHNKRLKCEWKPFIMARIMDVGNFFEITFKSLEVGVDFAFTLRVKDSFLEDNNKIFYLRSSRGGVIFEETKREADVTLDIGDLTSLMLGYISYMDLVFIDKIHYNVEAIKLFQLFTSYQDKIEVREYV